MTTSRNSPSGELSPLEIQTQPTLIEQFEAEHPEAMAAARTEIQARSGDRPKRRRQPRQEAPEWTI